MREITACYHLWLPTYSNFWTCVLPRSHTCIRQKSAPESSSIGIVCGIPKSAMCEHAVAIPKALQDTHKWVCRCHLLRQQPTPNFHADTSNIPQAVGGRTVIIFNLVVPLRYLLPAYSTVICFQGMKPCSLLTSQSYLSRCMS